MLLIINIYNVIIPLGFKMWILDSYLNCVNTFNVSVNFSFK